MNNAALLASLVCSDRNIRASIVGGQIHFEGGAHGEHALLLAVSDETRIRAHWRGYCEINGASVENVARRVRVRGLTRAQVRWAARAPDETGSSHSDESPHEQLTFGSTWIEGPAAALDEVAECLTHMSEILLSDGASYIENSDEMTPEFCESVSKSAAKCCITAERKIRKALADADHVQNRTRQHCCRVARDLQQVLAGGSSHE